MSTIKDTVSSISLCISLCSRNLPFIASKFRFARNTTQQVLLLLLLLLVTSRILTQSIGLLLYPFLSRTGQDRIVLHTVDYQFNSSTGTPKILRGNQNFMSNLLMLLQWSPYLSEADLLKEE
ncbi:protein MICRORCHIDIA 6-like [Castanea sativa]|uniref:protein MICRORCHIDIA 6-like n=1 Tax=Castanea sativa TaxID=21020 RepID=UPI003F64AE3F